MIITIRFEDRWMRFKVNNEERIADVVKRAKHAFEVHGLFLLRGSDRHNYQLSDYLKDIPLTEGCAVDLIAIPANVV